MTILGISSYYHDSAAALIHDGRIVAAAHEERFTRKKHDERFPLKAIEFCLREAGLNLADIQAVSYYEKPLLKFDRLLETYLHSAPFGAGFFVKSFPSWIQEKLFLRRELTKQFRKLDARFDDEKIFFSDHHLSHAASSFYPSPFEEAVTLTLDGVGEWATASVGVGQGSSLDIKKEMRFPHSLGFFYSALTVFCGFKVNSGEYKLMGLAPYGTPRFTNQLLDQVASLTPDGAVHLNMEYFDFLSGERMASSKMSEIFSVPARAPESPMERVYLDIAASAQKALEVLVLGMVQHIAKDFPSDNLCLAGGVALNCVANSRLLKEGPFKKIWIQPAAGDAGGSLGAALALHHQHFQKPRRLLKTDSERDAMRGALLGPQFDDQAILSALEARGLKYVSLTQDEAIRQSAQDLASGKSLGWFQGRMEFGPRALGGRSILADARNPETQKKLNLQIKFRESFRPFAPIVLSEDASDWFEFEGESPYMLFVADVKKSRQVAEPESIKELPPLERLRHSRSSIPAVTHVDMSARLQTVHKDDSPILHQLLSEFKKLTGCPVLVNTSFNVRGEPIVCTPDDAIRCFLGTDLDVLVLGRHIVYKSQNLERRLARHDKNFSGD